MTKTVFPLAATATTAWGPNKRNLFAAFCFLLILCAVGGKTACAQTGSQNPAYSEPLHSPSTYVKFGEKLYRIWVISGQLHFHEMIAPTLAPPNTSANAPYQSLAYGFTGQGDNNYQNVAGSDYTFNFDDPQGGITTYPDYKTGGARTVVVEMTKPVAIASADGKHLTVGIVARRADEPPTKNRIMTIYFGPDTLSTNQYTESAAVQDGITVLKRTYITYNAARSQQYAMMLQHGGDLANIANIQGVATDSALMSLNCFWFDPGAPTTAAEATDVPFGYRTKPREGAGTGGTDATNKYAPPSFGMVQMSNGDVVVAWHTDPARDAAFRGQIRLRVYHIVDPTVRDGAFRPAFSTYDLPALPSVAGTVDGAISSAMVGGVGEGAPTGNAMAGAVQMWLAEQGLDFKLRLVRRFLKLENPGAGTYFPDSGGTVTMRSSVQTSSNSDILTLNALVNIPDHSKGIVNDRFTLHTTPESRLCLSSMNGLKAERRYLGMDLLGRLLSAQFLIPTTPQRAASRCKRPVTSTHRSDLSAACPTSTRPLSKPTRDAAKSCFRLAKPRS